ncbi:hypothetical protein ACHAW6_005975 [Cyclotella cf. meneghiniana]
MCGVHQYFVCLARINSFEFAHAEFFLSDMALILSIAGVRLSITPSANIPSNFVSLVRQYKGRIEADLSNFSGTIILSEDIDGDPKDILKQPVVGINDNIISSEGSAVSRDRGGSKNAFPEAAAKEGSNVILPECPLIGTRSISGAVDRDLVMVDAIPNTALRSGELDVLPMLQQCQAGMCVRRKMKNKDNPSEEVQSNGHYVVQHTEANYEEGNNHINLTFHEACSSDDINIDDLLRMLKRNPELASKQDEAGDYPAHIFANNDALFYVTESEDDLVEFLYELYCAFPGAFFAEGSSGQIPFAGAICDWIDDCHQLYRRDASSIHRVSELKTLSKSDRVVNALCVKAEVQLLSQLPAKAGCPRSLNCARYYLCLISRSSISDLYGQNASWSRHDVDRFHDSRKQLYNRIGQLGGILPIMLHMGEHLYEVSTKRSVKHIVESRLGRPFVVYLDFGEVICLLVLICSSRIIIELLYNSPQPVGTSYREFWGFAFTTAVFFTLKDIGIMIGFFSFENGLWKRHITSVSTIVGMFTTISVFASIGTIYVDENIRGRNFLGLVVGLVWWKLVLHVKGMSSSLSTLIYTILQIAGSLKYFLLIFLILIICFADMIQIVTKTSNQCDDDADFQTLCSLTPVQSYAAMWYVRWVEMSSLAEFSPFLIFLSNFFNSYLLKFLGLIILVNILIAIVTSEYEDARVKSRALFARARLEQAARHVAREKFFDPQGDLSRLDIGVKMWKWAWKLAYFVMFVSQEFFLVKSLFSCNLLRKLEMIDNFYFVCLVIYGIMHHVFLVATVMSVSAVAISQYDYLAWLRDSRIHKFTQISLVPVRFYLQSLGLYESESQSESSSECGN